MKRRARWTAAYGATGAWIFLAALVVHVVVRLPKAIGAVRARGLRRELRTSLADTRPEPPDPDGLVAADPAPPTMSRRGLLAFVGGGSVMMFGLSVGQTLDGPLRRTALLAPHGREYGTGPNDFQVNKTAASLGVTVAETDAQWRLAVAGAGRLHLSREDLLAMPLHTYALPIACVEGWSTEQTWTGRGPGPPGRSAARRGGGHGQISALPEAPEAQSAPDLIAPGQRLPRVPSVADLPTPDGTGAGSEDEPLPSTGQGLVQAPGGPLSPADRDLLVKVRQAGLWESPVGIRASRQAARARTRTHLPNIGRQHIALDADVRRVAARLRVPLPDKPSRQQLGFIAEIFGQRGVSFDRTAVMRLRLAHGGVFPVIAQVRASTQNKHIRDFAERAAKFVNGHMDMLEATGLVTEDALPPVPEVQSVPDVIPAGQNLPSVPPAVNVIGVFPTEFGPLSAADRDLLVKVRQAGLWEIPVGREAARRAARAETREMLGEIARQHEKLDADVTSVAARLRVPLPDEPSAQQQGFIKEIFGRQGLSFDKTAVKRLRLAHGGVFPVIAQVRASTQNTLIRDFAERAATFVNDHMDMLEATGLVNVSAIPAAPVVNSAPAPVPSGSPAPSAPPATSVISTND